MALVKISELVQASIVNGDETHIFNQNGNTKRGKIPITTVTARQMGAVLDGITDDTAAIQALLDFPDDWSAGVAAVDLVIDGPALITESLLLRRKNGRLRMAGWGSSTSTPKGPYLKWGGDAGAPMLTVQEMWGGEIDGIRLVGNSAAKPSAGLYFNMAEGINSNTWSTIKRVWIGGLWGYDVDDEEQFATGILFDGLNQNNDMFHLEQIVVHRANTGIKFGQTQMGYHWLQNFTTEYCNIGIDAKADIGGSNVHLMHSTGYDLRLGNGAQVNLEQYVSEGSAAMADLTGPGQCQLTVRGGYWQANEDYIREDGVVINGLQQFPVEVGLEDFSFTLHGAYAGPTPKIVLKSPPANASKKYLRLINPSGILAANIDMSTQIAGDVRVVRIERSATGGNDFIQTQNIYGYPENLNEHRFDLISTTLRQKDETTSATTASTNEISSERGLEVGVAVNNEVGKWNFVVAPSRYNIGRISCRVGPLWTDSGNLLFWTKESGAAIQEVMRLHNVAADGETMASLLTNNGGSVALRRVLVGPADSGGAGYRYLRVTN